MTDAEILRFIEEELDWIQEGLHDQGMLWPYDETLIEISAVENWEDMVLTGLPTNEVGVWPEGGDAVVAVRINDQYLFDRTADLLHEPGFFAKVNPTIASVRTIELLGWEDRRSHIFVRHDRMPSDSAIKRLWHGREFESLDDA